MKHPVRIIFIIIIIYGVLYLSSFWDTPLGQTAVLDGAENIRLANQIYAGTLDKEPFFRSMLYPALLSLFFSMGVVNGDTIFTIASLLGILSHFISSFLVFLCSKNLWQNSKIAAIAALVFGLYPPAIFFAAEPLDTTISITFMLGSLLCFFKAIDSDSLKNYITSGFLLGVAGLLRSNLLPFAIIYLVYPCFDRKKLSKCLISVISITLIMLLNGFACYLHSNQFKILPWQGASNLYSANSLRANGKYYRQTIMLPDREQGTNPARAEAELIYGKETGEIPPFDLNKFNKFWLTKTFQDITAEPQTWLSLMLKKVYYLFNNYEQYNNKTFSFHKNNSFLLKYNPLCYGLIIILFFISLCDLLKNKPQCSLKHYCLLTALFFMSLGIIAFYVSSRFRLPIVPLLIILGTGILQNKIKAIFTLKNTIIAVVIGTVTFSGFYEVNDTSTWKEDRLLNAFACSRLGYDKEQIYWADEVLKEDSHNLQALRLKIVGFTNLALAGTYSNNQDWNIVSKELDYLNENNIYFNDCLFLLGCYNYKIRNNTEKAFEIWKTGLQEPTDLFSVCLVYTGGVSIDKFSNIEDNVIQQNPYLAVALRNKGRTIKFVDSEVLNKTNIIFDFLFNP